VLRDRGVVCGVDSSILGWQNIASGCFVGLEEGSSLSASGLENSGGFDRFKLLADHQGHVGELVLNGDLGECHADYDLVRDVDYSSDVHLNCFTLFERRDKLRTGFLFVSTNEASGHVVGSWELERLEILACRDILPEFFDHFLGLSRLVKSI